MNLLAFTLIVSCFIGIDHCSFKIIKVMLLRYLLVVEAGGLIARDGFRRQCLGGVGSLTLKFTEWLVQWQSDYF